VTAGVERLQRQRPLGQREGRRRVVGHQAQLAERQQVADVAGADLPGLGLEVGIAHAVQVRQRIAAPQRDRVSEQGSRAAHIAVGSRLGGALVQDVQVPQVHGEELGLQEPDRVTVGTQVVARLAA